MPPPSSTICRVYSLSSKIFLSPPPGRCFTLASDPILEPTWMSTFSLWICTLPPPGAVLHVGQRPDPGAHLDVDLLVVDLHVAAAR